MLSTGEFSQPGIYCRRRWRRVQHLRNEFWSWWCKEFLSLQEKQKWSSTRKNFQQEDIVILKDDNCRQNEWKLAKTIKTFPDEKGFVHAMKLLIGSIDRNGSMDNQTFVRPVDKVAFLVESDKAEWWGSVPNKGAMKQEVKIHHILGGASCIWTWQSYWEPYWNIENKIVCFSYLKNLRKIFLFF